MQKDTYFTFSLRTIYQEMLTFQKSPNIHGLSCSFIFYQVNYHYVSLEMNWCNCGVFEQSHSLSGIIALKTRKQKVT